MPVLLVLLFDKKRDTDFLSIERSQDDILARSKRDCPFRGIDRPLIYDLIADQIDIF